MLKRAGPEPKWIETVGPGLSLYNHNCISVFLLVFPTVNR